MSARRIDAAPGPLTGLAGRLRRTIDGMDAVDGGPSVADVHARQTLEDRLEALVPLVGQERPRTPGEALVQLAVASATVDRIMGTMTTAEQDKLARERALVEGCLYGVRGLLEELAGAALDDRLSDYWMRASLDPHRVLDRLAAG